MTNDQLVALHIAGMFAGIVIAHVLGMIEDTKLRRINERQQLERHPSPRIDAVHR